MGSNALTIYEKVDDPIAFSNEFALTMTAMTKCSVEQGKAVALTCLCEGLTPLDFVRRYHLIDGKPSMRADAMLSEFRINHGGKHEIIKSDGDEAAVALTDREGNRTEWRLTWEEAKQEAWPWGKRDPKTGERIVKTNWATPRARANMLWARAVSEGLRRVCPELVSGVYTPEEMEDVLDTTPQPAMPTASEVLAKQAEEVIDVPFGIVSDSPEPTSESETAQESQQGEPESAICDKIRQLYDDLEVPQEKQQTALKKRGVTLLRHLPEDQAKELLAKLIDLKRAKDAAKN